MFCFVGLYINASVGARAFLKKIGCSFEKVVQNRHKATASAGKYIRRIFFEEKCRECGLSLFFGEAGGGSRLIDQEYIL
ncbi:hypothetical protein [Desulfobaculum bizertense]|uniref:hypothetical protein n=1 Tax=Desulfobaculum bizertense TaxID=376490 RepID=UPI00117C47E6|nr:hypothetical protein [Desulfobaculum bizertense]